ncbi:MAG: hypothetical protein EOP21_07305 [Hyphomicrobiales bacterium]|nr:MAG: hypothetical protein EOP21_07305 [Hyphomicrobiales bacterium]
MHASINQLRQSIISTQAFPACIARLEKQLADVTELYRQIQASSDPAEIQRLRVRMKVVHPAAVSNKLGQATMAHHKARMANLECLDQARADAMAAITKAAGGPAGMHYSPRARLLCSQVLRAVQAALGTPAEDRLAKLEEVVQLLENIAKDDLAKVRESAARRSLATTASNS